MEKEIKDEVSVLEKAKKEELELIIKAFKLLKQYGESMRKTGVLINSEVNEAYIKKVEEEL